MTAKNLMQPAVNPSALAPHAVHFDQPANRVSWGLRAVGCVPIDGAICHTEWMDKTMTDQAGLDVAAMLRQTQRARADFDKAAVLHKEVAKRLLERLDYVRLAPTSILNLGCGTGLATADLRQRYPRAQQLVMDVAPAWVARARRSASRWRRLPGVAGGLRGLPFANNSFDLIFSTLAFHRCEDLAAFARELQRVLTPGGLVMFATFGPDTLQELRAAWLAVDSAAHVQPFVDMHDIGDALVSARLADPVMDMEHFTLTYAGIDALVSDLTALGLRNALRARAVGLTTPRRWRQVCDAYAQQRDGDGRLPATWEVAYGHAWGTDAQAQITTEPGEVRLPLDTLLVPHRQR